MKNYHIALAAVAALLLAHGTLPAQSNGSFGNFGHFSSAQGSAGPTSGTAPGNYASGQYAYPASGQYGLHGPFAVRGTWVPRYGTVEMLSQAPSRAGTEQNPGHNYYSPSNPYRNDDVRQGSGGPTEFGQPGQYRNDDVRQGSSGLGANQLSGWSTQWPSGYRPR